MYMRVHECVAAVVAPGDGGGGGGGCISVFVCEMTCHLFCN